VAVSRAKKELVLIASSIWMKPDMQKNLLGYSVKCGAEETEEKEREKLFLRNMMSYVQEQSAIREADGYGLQRSSLSSVFDKVPYYREKAKINIGAVGKKTLPECPSAPELCMLKALCNNTFVRNNYKLYREVELSSVNAIHTEDEECREYIEAGARFDIVLIQDNKICAIIEVDGTYHRTDEDQRNKDSLKDAAVASLGSAFVERRFFRFATDGTSRDEVEKVVEALRTAPDGLPEVDTEKLSAYSLDWSVFMGKVIVGIEKAKAGLYKLNCNYIEWDDQKLEEKLKERDVFISGSEKSNTIPSEFHEMRCVAENPSNPVNTVCIELTKDDIVPSRNNRNNVIKNLKAESFHFLMRGKEGEERMRCGSGGSIP
jgi:hypothetical protein